MHDHCPVCTVPLIDDYIDHISSGSYDPWMLVIHSITLSSHLAHTPLGPDTAQ